MARCGCNDASAAVPVRLFWDQTEVPTAPITIPAAGVTTPTTLLTLPAFDTDANDAVKLDFTTELSFNLGGTALALLATAGVIPGMSLVLQRSSNGGLFTDVASIDVSPSLLDIDLNATVTQLGGLVNTQLTNLNTFIGSLLTVLGAIPGIDVLPTPPALGLDLTALLADLLPISLVSPENYNLTWVDVPGFGSQVYQLVFRIARPVTLPTPDLLGALTGVVAETRSLNALVVGNASGNGNV